MNGEPDIYTPTASTSGGPSTDELRRDMARREDEDQDTDLNPLEDAEAAAVEAQAHDLEQRRQTQLRIQNRFTKASVIIPPENFGLIEDNLYRSSQPTELNFPFLQRLNLRTLIWLAPEEPNQPFLEFLKEHQITMHHLGVLHTANAWDPLTEEIVLKALDIILQPASYPLMIMCNLGRHRTGTVVGCLRKLQRWNLASIFEEYRRHAGARVKVMNEQFIELFDTDNVIIPTAPTVGGSAASATGSRINGVS